MARENFASCHAVTAKWEGGWSDHKADPGGKTMYGVTEAVYHAWLRKQGKPEKPVRGITLEDAHQIYKAEYWTRAGCETLAAGVDLATYDPAVNSGVSRAKKWLASSIGGTDVQTVKRICAARLSFVRGLGTWKTFGKGWARRIADVEVKAVVMVLRVGASGAQVQDRLAVEAGIAQEAGRQDRDKLQAASAGAGASGAAGAAVDYAPWVTWALLAFVAAAGVTALIYWHRSRVSRERAAAYANALTQMKGQA